MVVDGAKVSSAAVIVVVLVSVILAIATLVCVIPASIVVVRGLSKLLTSPTLPQNPRKPNTLPAESGTAVLAYTAHKLTAASKIWGTQFVLE